MAETRPASGAGPAGAGPADTRGYWAANLRLTVALLCIWFAVSYGAGILFRDALDRFSLGGAPLGFWFAQQGAIYVFVVLIFVYCAAMRRLERRYGIEAERQPESKPQPERER